MKSSEQFIHWELTPERPFFVRDIAFTPVRTLSVKIHGGVIFFCNSGSAELSINGTAYNICAECEVTLLPDAVLVIDECSSDFSISLFVFSGEMLLHARRKFEPFFFKYIDSHPVYAHVGAPNENIKTYLTLLKHIYSDHGNRYGTAIATNLLRCILLNICDKVQRFRLENRPANYTCRENLYNRMMDLIFECASEHHDVAFYAEKLCVSQRYLSSVTKSVANESPKHIIDTYIISEIKLMLTFSDMTIQQIADKLHFPDQSYFGRFFRRYTGMSPLMYKKSEVVV